MKTDPQNTSNQTEPSSPPPNRPHLDDALLEKFMGSFYGYGNYSAGIWFIGMEEGGGGKFGEVRRRLETWQSRGEHELEDVRTYHEALGLDQFFKDPVKLQFTWARLIRLYLSANGLETDQAAVRDFQKEKLGRHGGDTCLVELMPLPSPGTNRWKYKEWSRLPYLSDREAYMQAILPIRLSHLKSRIAEHRPRWVVLYGKKYKVYWEKIAGKQMAPVPSYGLESCQDKTTGYLLIQHPAAWGSKNAEFIAAGKFIRREN